jgi:hypothetical protein
VVVGLICEGAERSCCAIVFTFESLTRTKDVRTGGDLVEDNAIILTSLNIWRHAAFVLQEDFALIGGTVAVHNIQRL